MFKTANGRVNLSGMLAGMREVKKIKGKRLSLHLEPNNAFRVIVEDKTGKVIFNDGFRYIAAARLRFDELREVMA